MRYTIAELAASLGLTAVGDTALWIDHLAEPADAGPNALAIAGTRKYAEGLARGQARAALLWAGAEWETLGLAAALLPERPRYALSGLSAMMDPGQRFPGGIHGSAVIDPSAVIGEDVSVGPLSVIGPDAWIGAGSVIGPQCFIGWRARLGAGAFLREQVSIGAHVRIGAHFTAGPGARIGGDGFSFVTPEQSGAEAARATLGGAGETRDQAWARIHSLGAVRLGDNIEIGANSTIDSGTIRATSIGDGTKIDSLVQVGHNAVVGRNTLLCAQVGVAGSARVGDNVVLGGKVGISDNIFVGDRAVIGGASIVLSNVPAGRVMLGYPATAMDRQMEIYKAQRRLPRLLSDVAALKRAVFNSGKDD